MDGDEPPRPSCDRRRCGLSSAEVTRRCSPVFDELAKERLKRHFTSDLDDVTQACHRHWVHSPSSRGEVQAMFFGLGADGTVGANKNSVKIIGEHTDLFVQGYFVYDSKKSGSVTVSHLRFGPEPLRSTYLIDDADFVACHQFELLDKIRVLDRARPGSVFLLNAFSRRRGDRLSIEVQRQIIDKASICGSSTRSVGRRMGNGSTR
jgi:pyruvate-ferredoxin/flavodoxin oxidoreductase